MSRTGSNWSWSADRGARGLGLILVPLVGPLSWRELLVVAVVMALLFGARRIPELLRSLGTGIAEFRKGIRQFRKEEWP